MFLDSHTAYDFIERPSSWNCLLENRAGEGSPVIHNVVSDPEANLYNFFSLEYGKMVLNSIYMT